MPTNIITYHNGIDYIISNHIIEFNRDYFEEGVVQPGQSFYGKLTDIIEKSLYSTYGSLIKINDPSKYNFNNVSGKAAINTVLQALQNSGYISNYQKALNVYYGLPVAPQNCKVLGLYESYNYIVDPNWTYYHDGNVIRIVIKTGTHLHKFIQQGTKLRVDRLNKELTVDAVDNRALIIGGDTFGQITVDNASEVIAGDALNVKLINKYPIVSITQESESFDATVTIKTSYESCAKLQHIIDIIQDLTDNKEYPEILIYGTSGYTHNYDGIYHITEARDISGLGQLKIYNPANDIEPKYNDFVFTTN